MLSSARLPSVRSLSLVLALLTGVSTSTLGQVEARILLDSTAQVIRGFGAANIVNWRPDMTNGEMETAFGVGDGQLGFSILRLRIPPDPNQWGINIPSATKAHEMGVTIIASPWTPPPSMKTNNSTVAGELRQDMYQAYAEYLDSFNTYMDSNGIPLYAVSVQNEPDVSVTYESCDWTGEQMRKFMAENAGSIGTRVMAPESFQFRKEMSDPILNDSLATANLGIVGGHIYGGGLADYPLAQVKAKEVWMTEHLDLGIDYESNFQTAMDIQRVMKANMSAYIWWYIVRFYGPISDGEQGPYRKSEVTKRGHMMAQFSRFIRPGFVRVNTDGPDFRSGVTISAYKDDRQVVIVAINTSTSPTDVSFSVEGLPLLFTTPYVTSETQNVEELEQLPYGNEFTATLGAKSVTTFVSDIRTISTEGEEPPQDSYRLEQNYPNPFSGSTTIAYEMPATGEMTLEVFDLLGRKVSTPERGTVTAGRHQATFDASRLPAGVYVYRLNAGGVVRTQRMMVAD